MFEAKKCACKVCGTKFALNKDDRYTAIRRESLLSVPTYYDAFDCPACGCQNIVGVRESWISKEEESDSALHQNHEDDKKKQSENR